MKKICIIIFVCFWSPYIVSQNIYKQLEQDLQFELDELVKQDNFPGITLSVLFNQNHQINLSAGYSDLENKAIMKPDSRMLAGSVGKIFFSAVILKLIEQGVIGLEDKAVDYLGDTDWFNSIPNSSDIKIRNLFNHTSGLPRHLFQAELLSEISKEPLKKRDPKECILSIVDKPAIHPVDKGWAYSDTNYIILGLIVEKLTSKELYKIIDEQLIVPLKLDLTSPSTNTSLDNLTQGYIGGRNIFQLSTNQLLDSKGNLIIDPTFEWAGGGYISNPKDLTKLIKYIHESDYLNNNTKELLCNPVNPGTGQPYHSGYGLGTFIWSKGSDIKYGHSGIFPGYVTQVEYSKINQYAIAIQINNDEQYRYMQQYIYKFDEIISKHLDEINKKDILENFKRQEDCWNNQDIECYMKAYASNGDQIQTISTGGVTFGYGNIIGDYKRYFPKGRMGKLHYDNINIRKLSDNLFFVTGRFNLKFKGREELLRGWFSVVSKKINGKWYMITDHSS